jgi:hypothetical protein
VCICWSQITLIVASYLKQLVSFSHHTRTCAVRLGCLFETETSHKIILFILVILGSVVIMVICSVALHSTTFCKSGFISLGMNELMYYYYYYYVCIYVSLYYYYYYYYYNERVCIHACMYVCMYIFCPHIRTPTSLKMFLCSFIIGSLSTMCGHIPILVKI